MALVAAGGFRDAITFQPFRRCISYEKMVFLFIVMLGFFGVYSNIFF